MAVYNQKRTSYSELMTVEEYKASIENGLFIDYDGFGYPVKDSWVDDSIMLKPSKQGSDVPNDATHVEWYNR